MAEADLQGETRGLEGAVLEELDVGGLVCDCVVRGEQGEEYWQRTQGHGGAGGGGGSQATAEAQTARFKAAKRWAEAAEAARKEDLLRAKMCSLRHFRTRRCFSIRDVHSGRGAVFPFEKEGEGEAGNRGEALAAAQKAKADF